MEIRNGAVCLFMICCTSLFASASNLCNAAPINQNLLNNSGFESDLEYWTTDQVSY